MSRIPNPYITGQPVSGPNFYGRQDIFRFVQNTFSSPQQNVIVLWGQRRMGKTSVLHELSFRLPPEFHPIYFDLQEKAQQRLNEVLYDLAREIAGSLNLDPPPRDDFLRDDSYFHERFLPQVYQGLGPKRLLFMFDEFETVDVPPVEGPTERDVTYRAFFPYLRRKLVSDRRLTFIFVTGRRLDEVDELILSTFKEARTESVSFLEEAEARRLIVEPASGILEYDEEAVGQIIFITACHPYLTQLVCFELFSYVEAAGRTQVTVGDVEAVVDRAIAAGRAGLAWLWVGLPMAERFVLSAVAHALREGRIATQYEIGRILEEYRVPFSGPELTQAPDNLTTWGLLRRTADGYEFVVELLRRWILKEYPLEQAKRQLESVSPRAIVLYELARAYHEDGDYDKAIPRYHDALVVNPNHIPARLGLAQALFEQGETEEAIIEFERAYTLDRARARDGLIEARQARAEALEKAGRVNEAAQEYETILSTAPHDLRVREWVANRWMARGKKYLREDHYEEAIAEYKKAAALNVSGSQERLIAAWRIWIEALEREDKAGEADQQYSAILGIAPDDVRVREWIANSLIGRGDRYLEEGRYDEASKAYDHAESIQPEKQQALAQRRHQLELAPDYDRAMRAHKVGDWVAAEKEWAELYKKDRGYARRDGKTVAVLLAEAIEKREGISKRRLRRLILVSSGLAVVVAALILWLGWGSVETSGQIGAGPIALVVRTVTPMPTPAPLPTNTPYSTYTPYPTYTPFSSPSPYPTYTPFSSPSPYPTYTFYPSPSPYPTYTSYPTYTPYPTTVTPEILPSRLTPLLGLGTPQVSDVDINRKNPEEMYVVAKGQGIYKTTDGGYRWELINAVPNVESLILGRANPQTVFAAADRVILKSTDGGVNWQFIELTSQRTGLALKGAIHVLAVAPSDDWVIYAGTDEGVYRSDDGGVNWELRKGGMGGRPIYTLAVVSGDGQLIYAAGKGAEIWRTLDGGNLWSQLPCSGEMEAIYALDLQPASDYEKNRLYIGADNSLMAVSVDGGHNWRLRQLGNERPLPLRDPLKIVTLTILDFRDSETVLLAATGDRENLFRNGIYKSTDGGLSWCPKNKGLPTDSSGTYSVHSIAVDPRNNRIIYAGTFSGLYKSTDGGESWTHIP